MAQKTLSTILALLISTFLVGCSTTQDVVLVKPSAAKAISSVTQMPEKGNSPEMDANLRLAIEKEGIQFLGIGAQNAQTSANSNAVISYVDVWKWDLMMYLNSISIRLFDGSSGDLLVTGEWRDSDLHGFRDAKLVVENVVHEMLQKIRSAVKAKAQ